MSAILIALVASAQSSADPIHVGPVSPSVMVFGVELSPSVDIEVGIQDQKGTVSIYTESEAVASLDKMGVIVKRLLRQKFGEYSFAGCSFSFAGADDASVGVQGGTAIVKATIRMNHSCALSPDRLDLYAAIAPQIEKGGVLIANVGAVKVALPSIWGAFNDVLTAKVRDGLSKALHSAKFSFQAGELGRFALQSVTFVQQGAYVHVHARIDGLLAESQLTTLVKSRLTQLKIDISAEE